MVWTSIRSSCENDQAPDGPIVQRGGVIALFTYANRKLADRLGQQVAVLRFDLLALREPNVPFSAFSNT